MSGRMLLAVATGNSVDLLGRFEKKMWNDMPHPEDTDGKSRIANATPLVDLTDDMKACASRVYNVTLPDNLVVWGKFDTSLPTGSIKARPAAYIIREAIISGDLRAGQTIIEATSGNFGIALGSMSELGLTVISLVSRKLQEGVFDELGHEGVRTIDLDMDICPAPGMEGSADILAAKAAASNLRLQLSKLGLDPTIFDSASSQIEALLVDQDVINLAKLLGRIYGMFCPEQYDNEMNIDAHRTITAPEIDQQLGEHGQSLVDYDIVCTFGTGGTSGGIARYMSQTYEKKSVYVIFPPAGQDVAGIRTRGKADGLGLYRPDEYAGEYESDFGKARRLLKYFVDNGHDLGESSALALYAAMQMAVRDGGGRFVVMVADGIEKYRKALESADTSNPQVSLEDAAAISDEYDHIVWVHPQYEPQDAGIEMLAKSLGVDKSKISITKASTVNRMMMTRKVPDEMRNQMQGKSLLVCMAGNTSLMASKVMAESGIATQSLNGGITGLPASRNRNPAEYVQISVE